MFKYFTREEFVCQATGENEIEDELILALDELREVEPSEPIDGEYTDV